MTTAEWKLKKKALGFCAHCCKRKAGEQVGKLRGTGVLCGECAEIHRQRNRFGRRKRNIPVRIKAPRYVRKYPLKDPLAVDARVEQMIALQAKMDTLRKNLVSAER